MCHKIEVKNGKIKWYNLIHESSLWIARGIEKKEIRSGYYRSRKADFVLLVARIVLDRAAGVKKGKKILIRRVKRLGQRLLKGKAAS